jgi:hypothetical protein
MHEEIRNMCRSFVGKLEELKRMRKICVNEENRDTEVGIATGYGLDDRRTGVRVPMKANIFTS